MAIVPPGNKQVESFQTELVVSSGLSLKLAGLASYGVVKNLSQNYTPTPPSNKLIDNVLFETVVSSGINVRLQGTQLYGVVKFTPPRAIKIGGLGLSGVVKDNSISVTLSSPRNKMVDNLQVEAVINTPNNVITVTGTQLYGVVKFTMPRNEALIFSLYYGENNPYL